MNTFSSLRMKNMRIPAIIGLLALTHSADGAGTPPVTPEKPRRTRDGTPSPGTKSQLLTGIGADPNDTTRWSTFESPKATRKRRFFGRGRGAKRSPDKQARRVGDTPFAGPNLPKTLPGPPPSAKKPRRSSRPPAPEDSVLPSCGLPQNWITNRVLASTIKDLFGSSMNFEKDSKSWIARQRYSGGPPAGKDASPALVRQWFQQTAKEMGAQKNFKLVLHPVLLKPNRIWTSARPGYNNGNVGWSQLEYEEFLIDMKRRNGENKIDVVFDLEEEKDRNGLKRFRKTELRGIRIEPRPIKDFGTPKSDYFLDIVTDVVQCHKDGLNVLIFCQAGEGRSGFVVTAAMMVIENWDKNKALAETRSKNMHYVEEWQQEQFLERFGKARAFAQDIIADEDHRPTIVRGCLRIWELISSCGSTKGMVDLLTQNPADLEKDFNNRLKDLEDEIGEFGNMDKFNKVPEGSDEVMSYTETCRSIIDCLAACEKACGNLFADEINDFPEGDWRRNQITRNRTKVKQALLTRWCVGVVHTKHPEFSVEAADSSAQTVLSIVLGRKERKKLEHKLKDELERMDDESRYDRIEEEFNMAIEGRWEELKSEFDQAMEAAGSMK